MREGRLGMSSVGLLINSSGAFFFFGFSLGEWGR
jgi:hypothetical protein